MKNSKGFALIEGLLILAIIAIIAGTGYYVYNSRNNTDKTLTSANSESDSTVAKTTPADPTAKWVEVTSGQKAFTVRVPDGWQATNWTSKDVLEIQSYSGLTYSAGHQATVTNGDGVVKDSGPPVVFEISALPESQASVLGVPAGTSSNYGPVNGIEGVKYVDKITRDAGDLKQGMTLYNYWFNGKQSLITVQYVINPGDKDQLTLVEQAISTLSFK